jgi:hypothetical protein
LLDLPSEGHLDTIAQNIDALYTTLTQAAPRPHDSVDCSVFAPATPKRGRQMLIQALLHRAEQLAVAIKIARETDDTANRKGFAKLSTNIERGALVQLFLEIPKLGIETPFQEITWEGEPVRVAYSVHVPTTVSLGPCQGTLHVMVRGLAVGEVIFELNIGEAELEGSSTVGLGIMTPETTLEDRRVDPVAIEAVQFKRAFISYSRKDVPQVLLYAEALDDCGINLLFDLTALEPGVEWESQLVGLIEKSDVFYLMWSKNAALSEWVDKETRVAIDRYDNKNVPRIRPVVIEHPVPEPPSHLKRFHFNSKWLAFRAAEKHALFLERTTRHEQ